MSLSVITKVKLRHAHDSRQARGEATFMIQAGVSTSAAGPLVDFSESWGGICQSTKRQRKGNAGKRPRLHGPYRHLPLLLAHTLSSRAT